MTYHIHFSHQDGRIESCASAALPTIEEARVLAAELADTLVIKGEDWLPTGWAEWTAQITDERRAEVLSLRFFQPPRGAWKATGPAWPTRIPL